MRLSPSHIAALGLALAGCKGVSRQAVSRDSAGVTVKVFGNPAKLGGPEWRSRVLFTTQTADSVFLGRYVDARFAPDTSLIVSHDDELLVFDPKGTFVRTLGRNGLGPGEYKLITRVGIAADGTLLINDFSTLRLTELKPSGEIRRVVPHLGRPSATYEVEPVTLLADGRILAGFWQLRPNRVDSGLKVGAFDRDPAPLSLYDSSGQFLETIHTWPGLERIRGEMRLPPPFARTTLVQGRGSYVAISQTDSLDLTLLAEAKPILRLIGATSGQTPTSSMVAQWEHHTRADLGDDAEIYLQAIQGAPQVPALPTLGGLGIDDRGNVWLGAYSLPSDTIRRWTVLTPQGEVIGQLTLPTAPGRALPGFRDVLDIFGDRLAILRESSDGALYVEVRQIGR